MGKEREKSASMCESCGKILDDKGINGYCDECHAKRWHAGIESTTDHANEIMHDDMNSKLDGPILNLSANLF
ncbi:MAG: hypothetical protein ACTSU9_03445 [Promethearchaeota archaeon]